jgi:hypothetical protein
MKNGFWKTGRPLQGPKVREPLDQDAWEKMTRWSPANTFCPGGGKPDRKGWFTTVWTKTNKGWRMIHDHS